jgi:cytochrome c-type biogenesis protein CcmH
MTEPIPVMADDAPAAAPVARPSRGLLATLCLGVLVIAISGYAWKGSPGLKPVAAVDPAAEAADEALARQRIEQMVSQLAQRMKDKPGDPVGWQMLGRSYAVLGRFDESIAAYQQSIALRANDAGTLADYASVLAMKNNGNATPQSDALLARALAADPNQLKALGLAGIAAFERGDYPAAIGYWEHMAKGLPPDGPDMQRLQASLEEARRRGSIAASGATVAAATPSTAGSTTNPAANTIAGADTSVSGTVTLAPALAAKASPTDTVFIFARAAQGPRMPLAVLRATVKDLPITFKLDDSMAMAPTAKISGAAQVIVGARISKSGNAMPQPGDLNGESAPVAPGATGLAITINSVAGS